RWSPALTILLMAAATLDAFSAPIAYVPARPISRLTARLRVRWPSLPTSPSFVRFPAFPTPTSMFRSQPICRRMPNGYSGITPASYEEHARELAHFPDQRSIDALRRYGVTHVWVHDRLLRDWTDNETDEAVIHSPDLQLLAEEGDLRLYRLKKSGGE